MALRILSLALAIFAAGCSVQVGNSALDDDNASTRFVDPSDGRAPYSQSVRSGHLVFLSGVLGSVNGELVPGGVEAETHQAIDNIVRGLEAHGLELDDVVKCTVFLADIDDFAAMNSVYTTRFGPPRPARTTVAAVVVANAAIEIDCIAAVRY